MSTVVKLPVWAEKGLSAQAERCYRSGLLLIQDDAGNRFCGACLGSGSLVRCQFRLPDGGCKDANTLLKTERPFINSGLI